MEYIFPFDSSKKEKSASETNIAIPSTSAANRKQSEQKIEMRHSSTKTLRSVTFHSKASKIIFCCFKKSKVKVGSSSSISSNETLQSNS